MLLTLALLFPWVMLGFGAWLGYQFLRQNGRILLHLDDLDRRLGELAAAPAPAAAPKKAPALPPGLPIGSAAPEFDLPDLSGGRRALSHFRGQRVLLIFFNPKCGFCAKMAGDLAVLPTDGAEGRPVPVLVTTADADANRKFFHEHGIRCPALLQEKMEVASQYKASGTPMGYLIDEQGRIASVVAAGAPAVLSLAGRGSLTAEAAESAEKGAKEHKGNRSLADSRLQRSGLPVGTPAPEFTLPRVEGGELSLSEYRGRKVLLVFSDPHCGPCNALAPQLEQSYRRSGDVQVVLISRGEVEENHAKVAEHGLTFPVVLQRKWEVSKEYAMFATPVGYLIDENGLTAAAAAVGTDAILKLLAGAASQAPAPVPGKKCPCGKIAGECACARKNGRALAEKR